MSLWKNSIVAEIFAHDFNLVSLRISDLKQFLNISEGNTKCNTFSAHQFIYFILFLGLLVSCICHTLMRRNFKILASFV